MVKYTLHVRYSARLVPGTYKFDRNYYHKAIVLHVVKLHWLPIS